MIEHLSFLKSEAAMNNMFDVWCSSQTRHILLLIIDMGKHDSIKRLNFVRSTVEHRSSTINDLCGKHFFALCHYPASTPNFCSCYPALFLGNWTHSYLDTAVNEDQCTNVKQCFSMSLQDRLGTLPAARTFDIFQSTEQLLPQVLVGVISQPFFYNSKADETDTSSINGNMPFHTRYRNLQIILATRLGDESLASLLCHKFSTLWSREALSGVIHKTAQGVVKGLTQTSLSTSLNGTLQDSLGTFLVSQLSNMNALRNLDVLWDTEHSKLKMTLFKLFVEDQPVKPLNELILQQGHKISSKQLPACPPGFSGAKFPFFHAVATFIDQAIFRAEQRRLQTKLCKDNDTKQEADVSAYVRVAEVHAIIQDEVDSNNGTATPTRASGMRSFIDFMSKCSTEDSVILLDLYIADFLRWRFTSATPSVLKWFARQKDLQHDALDEVVHVHLLGRRFEQEIWCMTSLHEPHDDWSVFNEYSKCENKSQSILEIFADFYIKAFLTNNNTHIAESFVWHARQLHTRFQADSDLYSAKGIHKVRCLVFVSALLSAKAPQSVIEEATQEWIVCAESDNGTLASFITYIGSLHDQDSNPAWRFRAENKMFRTFFSKWWLEAYGDKEDIHFLLSFLQDDCKFAKRKELYSALLENIFTDESITDGHGKVHVHGQLWMPKDFLKALIRMDPKDSGVGDRSGQAPNNTTWRFLPEWVRRTENNTFSGSEARENSGYYADYENSAACCSNPLAECIFHCILCDMCDDMNTGTSRDLSILAHQRLKKELNVDQRSRTMQQRLLARSSLSSTEGTLLSSIVTDVTLLLFIWKAAHELTRTGRVAAFDGLESDLALKLFDDVMRSRHGRFQEIFFSIIVNERGESHMLHHLQGALSDFSWSKIWISGASAANAEVALNLCEAEKELSEETREEFDKERDFRRCPSCDQLFGVDQMNCQQFVCGRNTHMDQSRPTIGDVVVRDTYGCGNSFSYGQARPYVRDSSKLDHLRQRVTEARNSHATHLHNAELWAALKDIEFPHLSFSAESSTSYSTLPIEVLSATELGETPAMKLLFDNRKNLRYFSNLPVLIKVRKKGHLLIFVCT
jgi:hypothetical protein